MGGGWWAVVCGMWHVAASKSRLTVPTSAQWMLRVDHRRLPLPQCLKLLDTSRSWWKNTEIKCKAILIVSVLFFGAFQKLEWVSRTL